MTFSIDKKSKKSENICKFNKLEPASVWGGGLGETDIPWFFISDRGDYKIWF